MNSKKSLPFLLGFSFLLTFSFLSCGELGSTNTSSDDNSENSESETTEIKHSEMSTQQRSDFVAVHAKHLSFVDNKMVEIKNEHVGKKDHYEFECENGFASLERHYNDNGDIHFLMTHTHNQDSTSSSAKHHFFWEDKLIYQFYHHEVEKDGNYMVDDHKTFFKDGELLKCLERTYSYKKDESAPHDVPYELVNLDADSKLTKDLEKLLTLSEEEIKTYLCK